MFDDIGTLCLLGIVVIGGFLLLSRFLGGMGGGARGGTDFSQRGTERRTIDNPEVRSQGAFGRDARSALSRTFRRSSGGGGSLFSGSRQSSGGRVDNSEVKSRGSFGRSKK